MRLPIGTIRQTFILKQKEEKAEEAFVALEEKLKKDEKAKTEARKYLMAERSVDKQEKRVFISAGLDALATAKFAYDLNKKTARFGLRGQDIQDQLQLQDMVVNKGLGIAGTAVASGGNPYAIALSIAMSAVNTMVNVYVQNKQYEYNRSIDQNRQILYKERVGETAWNNSRRN